MTVNETLAIYSNYLVYGAMAAFTVSMIAFAASFAAMRTTEDLPAESVPTDAEVPAGGVAVATKVATGGSGDGADDDAALPPGRRAGNIGMSTMWLGTILLGLGVLLRGLSVSRAPWGNMCEFAMTSAFVVALLFVVLSLRRDLRWLGIFVSTSVLLVLGLAMTVFYTEAAQLVPALKSYWLLIHVSAAMICGAAFCIGAIFTVLFLIADTGERRRSEDRSYWLSGFARRLPAAAKLDSMAYRTNAFLFPLWTFAIIAGAVWAENAWGRYWGWDPKETWAFITWVAYAAYLHARATAGWKGRKAAYIALVAFGCFVFNFIGINILVSGLHSYGGV
ncbi:MAG: c-type cytochrome biogenesis protein CcsB [Candidatus Nanopelagicales bacterium]